MFCPRCGKEQIDNTKFCRNCGEEFNYPINQGANVPKEPEDTQGGGTTSKGVKNWDRVIWAIVIGFVLGSIIMWWIVPWIIMGDTSPGYFANGECDVCGQSAEYEVFEKDAASGETRTVNEFCELHAFAWGLSEMPFPDIPWRIKLDCYLSWLIPSSIIALISYQIVKRRDKKRRGKRDLPMVCSMMG